MAWQPSGWPLTLLPPTRPAPRSIFTHTHTTPPAAEAPGDAGALWEAAGRKHVITARPGLSSVCATPGMGKELCPGKMLLGGTGSCVPEEDFRKFCPVPQVSCSSCGQTQSSVPPLLVTTPHGHTSMVVSRSFCAFQMVPALPVTAQQSDHPKVAFLSMRKSSAFFLATHLFLLSLAAPA